jgi:hypothetical protein
MRFTLLEELILKEEPHQLGGGPAEHHRLLKIVSDRAVDPGKDSAIHLDPIWMINQVLVGEHIHMVHHGGPAKNDKKHSTPLPIVVCGLIQADWDERLDIEDDICLSMDHQLWPIHLDMTDSLYRQTAGEPHTPYWLWPHHS